MTSMPTKFTGMMRTGGGLPPTRVLPPMRTGGGLPPTPTGNTGIVPPHMRTGGGLPPTQAPVLRTGGPDPATSLYGSMRAQNAAQPRINTASPDAGRMASDGNTPNLPQPASLPPGTEFKQRAVSATGMPSAPPGRVGRPAGGLFKGMMGV